ncbi:hypothetical protein DL767_004987 [Monosporascus sp. MG133]|nr:hypothetical protein DL767_004987 [Monosporascus sp. MG133]
MSFLKKLTSELDNLGLGSDKKKDDGRSSRSGHRGNPGQDYEGGYYPGQGSGSGYGQPYQQAPPSSAGSYPAQAPQQHYSRPRPPAVGPVYSPPPNKPPIPVGWIPQYDPRYQRWYYAEEATGRTQWEAPGYRPPGPDRREYGSQEQHGYGTHGGYENSDRAHGKEHGSSGAMLGAAAGGVAAGAIGGALLANALDEEHHQTYAADPGYAAPAPVYEPAYNAEGEYVDQSDRESLAEARAEYEEALEAAADSSASSSEQEELEEAYEDYQEECEEAYGDD